MVRINKYNLKTFFLPDDVSKVVTEKLPFNDTSKYVHHCEQPLMCDPLAFTKDFTPSRMGGCVGQVGGRV